MNKQQAKQDRAEESLDTLYIAYCISKWREFQNDNSEYL